MKYIFRVIARLSILITGVAIVLTTGMPVVYSFELAAEIKRIREDIPVIVCTGFSALLMKPVGRREMAKTIRDVLDNGASGKSQNNSE